MGTLAEVDEETQPPGEADNVSAVNQLVTTDELRKKKQNVNSRRSRITGSFTRISSPI